MFSYGIFKSNIKRFWIVPVVATIILFLVTTFQMILRTNDIKERILDDTYVVDDVEMVNKQNKIESNLENKYSSEISIIGTPETTSQNEENIIIQTNNINQVNNVTNTVAIVNEEIDYISDIYYPSNHYEREHYVEILYNPIVMLTIFVLPVLLSILVFKYTNEEKNSSFIHGLPLSKKKLYITNVLTGIAMYVVPFLVNLIIILLLMCLCGCNSDVVESDYVDVNNLEYYGYLVIPKVNMKLGFYNVDNEKNNVGENVTLIDTGINNTYLLAAHSGSGPLAYFNDLRYLSVGDKITLIIDGNIMNYEVVNIRNEIKNGKINIKNEKNQVILTTCNQVKKGYQLIIEGSLIK